MAEVNTQLFLGPKKIYELMRSCALLSDANFQIRLTIITHWLYLLAGVCSSWECHELGWWIVLNVLLPSVTFPLLPGASLA